ncbi:MAG: hypothetical protein GY710_08645 [Desulfobacteraceae bacterium]|nr:hypothetical protein [Desulfobacteraceae bacterium]
MINPKIDYAAWRFWVDVGQYIFGIIIAFYIWFSNRAKATDKDVQGVKKDMGKIESRVTKLEAGSISHDDLGKVYERMNKVSDQMSELTGTTKGIKGTVDIIQEHLLNNGGKK